MLDYFDAQLRPNVELPSDGKDLATYEGQGEH